MAAVVVQQVAEVEVEVAAVRQAGESKAKDVALCKLLYFRHCFVTIHVRN